MNNARPSLRAVRLGAVAARLGAVAARLGALAAPALVAALCAGCTTFDGLVADGGYLDIERASRLCARIFTCPAFATTVMQSTGVPADETSFSACMSWLAGPIPPRPGGVAAQAAVLGRMADAASCAEATAIAAVRGLPDGDATCAGTDDACLDDHTWRDCHRRRIVRCDSPLYVEGSTCGSEVGSTERCQTGSCIPGALPSCEGDVLKLCEPATRVELELQCAAHGLICVPSVVASVLGGQVVSGLCTTPSDGADRAPPDRIGACDDGPQRCSLDGTSVVVCSATVTIPAPVSQLETTLGAVQSVFDCTALGWTCAPAGVAASLASCARPDAECSPAEDLGARCDGDDLPICLAGRKAVVDCAAAGTVCKDAAPGSPKGPHCAFSE